MLEVKNKAYYVAEPWRQQERKKKPGRVVHTKINIIQKYAQATIVMVLATLAVTVISHYSVTIGISYQVNLAQKQLEQLSEERNHLQIKKAQLSSLDRIEGIAKEELGLIYPEENQQVFLTLRR